MICFLTKYYSVLSCFGHPKQCSLFSTLCIFRVHLSVYSNTLIHVSDAVCCLPCLPQAHEGSGSLLSYLKRKGWGNRINAYCSRTRDDFVMLEVNTKSSASIAVYERRVPSGECKSFYLHRRSHSVGTLHPVASSALPDVFIQQHLPSSTASACTPSCL